LSESKTSVRRIEAVERHREALELRALGKTLEQIADKLGYASASGASKAIDSALQRTLQEPADTVRSLELRRLDIMLEATMPAAMRGIPQAVDRVLKIMERRAKLLGLDAPQKQEITGAGGGPVAIDLVEVVRPPSSGE
jgi:hypothetical protein